LFRDLFIVLPQRWSGLAIREAEIEEVRLPVECPSV
jgi:hypothetical protein